MKLFGRPRRGDRPDLTKLAAFDALADAEASTLPAPVGAPMQLGDLRTLGEDELSEAGGEDVTYLPVVGPREPVPFVSSTRLKGDTTGSLAEPAETPAPIGLHSVWDVDSPLAPSSPDADVPSPRFSSPGLHVEPSSVLSKADAANFSQETHEADLLASGKMMIGGEEADLVPLIPDTKPEAESEELDDEAVVQAAVEALRGACDLLVTRVNRMRTMQEGGRFMSAMIAVVGELDAKYSEDWGVVRRNGLEEVINEIRAVLAEGDRFVLESLESGHGTLTDEAFLRDLKTVAVKDRQRIVAEYTIFLVFVYRCVLRQYLRPLEQDSLRMDEVAARLDYLIDGVREVLIQHVNARVRA